LLDDAAGTTMASFAGKPADGGLWTGPKVAAWMSELLGRPVSAQREYLRGCAIAYAVRDHSIS